MRNQASSYQMPLAILLLLGALSAASANGQSITMQNFKETSNQVSNEPELAGAFNRADGLASSQVRANSPLLAVPLSFARFMFPKGSRGGRGAGHDQAALMIGVSNKRSAANNMASVASGGLDTLIGASGLGKRSVPSEYMSMEPVFGGRPVALLRGFTPQSVRNLNGPPVAAWPDSTADTAMEMFEAAAAATNEARAIG